MSAVVPDSVVPLRLYRQFSVALLLGCVGVLVLGVVAPPKPFSRSDGAIPLAAGGHGDIRRQPPGWLSASPPRGDLAQTLPEALLRLEGGLKKRLFIRTVLPLIFTANREVAARRHRLVAISKKRVADDGDQAFLSALAQSYGLDSPDTKKLLKMVDTVPASLALAQAIIESGWGKANLARNGNALFGQRVFGGSGLLPAEVGEDEGFRLRSYRDLLGGVRAYIGNLNRLPAYEDFRLLRALMRARGEAVDSFLLAGTLSRYSEEREEYVLKLQKVMADNDLTTFDKLGGF